MRLTFSARKRLQIAWLHAVFHRETFEAEHDRAWEMIDTGRGEELDPLWLSCYFLVRPCPSCSLERLYPLEAVDEG